MKIVLDSTVLRADYRLNSAEFELLQNFVAKNSASVFVPRVVFDEVMNGFREDLEKAVRHSKELLRLLGDKSKIPNINIDDEVKAFAEKFGERLPAFRAEYLEYPTIAHQQLVARDLARRKPFVSSGKGYRDALIWHSLVDLLKICNDKVVFISQNWNDWCENQKEYRFHRDLLIDLQQSGIPFDRLAIARDLAEFNRQYTVSSLPIEEILPTEEETQINYGQILIDAQNLIKSQLLIALPDALRRIGAASLTFGESGVIDMSGPDNIQHERPRTLDLGRRLLQFSADYRVAVDLIIQRSDAIWWMNRFSFHLRQDWHYDQIRVYVTLPVRASFHMLEQGENTEQFSLAAAEIIDS